MNVINPYDKELIENGRIKKYAVINWGKAMARSNEIIQRDLLRHCGVEAFDPELDADCPSIKTDNNSPGFDIVVRCADGSLKRVQSKLRQVVGVTDFSRQTHFETTRRHSKKNEGSSSDSGHVAYSCEEFDYVMITLVNVGKDGKERANRNSVDKWSFSIIPIHELINKEKKCCVTHISSKLLEKYKYKIDPEHPPTF